MELNKILNPNYLVDHEENGYHVRARVEHHMGLTDLSGMVYTSDGYVGRFSYTENNQQAKISLSVSKDHLNTVETLIKNIVKEAKK